MGVFNAFYIVQMVPNRPTHNIYFTFGRKDSALVPLFWLAESNLVAATMVGTMSINGVFLLFSTKLKRRKFKRDCLEVY